MLLTIIFVLISYIYFPEFWPISKQAHMSTHQTVHLNESKASAIQWMNFMVGILKWQVR